jgi:6-phosphogluconolactonase
VQQALKNLQLFRWLVIGVTLMASAFFAYSKTIFYVSNAISQTVHMGELDLATGDLIVKQTVHVGGAAMPMSITADHRYLFVALRSQPFTVVSFAVDPCSGSLSKVGAYPLPQSMASISVDSSGRMLMAASYGGDLLSVSRIAPNGEVSAAHQLIPTPAMAHDVKSSKDNRFAFATSLGGDVVLQFEVDADNQLLRPNHVPKLSLPPGSGPRHLAMHPTGRFVFLLDELDGKVHGFELNAQNGTLTSLGRWGSLPITFSGKPAAADIHITPDGRFIYTSDRGSNTLTGFRVDPQTGYLDLIGHWPSETQPRGFNIDPSGRYLLEVGQKSGMLSVHAIQENGALKRIGSYPFGQGVNWVELINLPPR